MEVEQTISFFCESSLSFFNKTHGKFWPKTLEWDPIRGKFFSLESKSPSRYYFWKFIIYFIFGLVTAGSCVINLLTASNDTIVKSTFSVVFLLIATFDILFARTLHKNWQDIATVFQAMKDLAKGMKSYKTKSVTRRTNWKYVSLICSGLTLECFLVGLFYSFMAVKGNLDPALATINLLGFKPGIHVFVMRQILMFLFIQEASGLYPMFITLLFYWLEMQSTCISYIEKLDVINILDIKLYKKLQIITQSLGHVLSKWIQLVMCIVFGLIVVAGIATVRFASYMPVSSFMLLPVISLADVISIHLLFPFLTESFYRTRAMIDNSMLASGYKLKKIQQVELKALKPISIKFGAFFVVTKKTKIAFYEGVIDRLVGGILL